MLYHITPQIRCSKYGNIAIELLDITIPELDLNLKEGSDVVVRKPYPNKNYLVACRKIGKKAIDGILINSEVKLSEYTVITRWVLNRELVISHVVKNRVLDDEHELVSDNMCNLYGTTIDNKNYPHRFPQWFLDANVSPLQANTCMDIDSQVIEGYLCGDERTSMLGNQKVILSRVQCRDLPTVSLEQVIRGGLSDRFPEISDAFNVDRSEQNNKDKLKQIIMEELHNYRFIRKAVGFEGKLPEHLELLQGRPPKNEDDTFDNCIMFVTQVRTPNDSSSSYSFVCRHPNGDLSEQREQSFLRIPEEIKHLAACLFKIDQTQEKQGNPSICYQLLNESQPKEGFLN
ncbi:DUF6012 family protein [Vibrio parahaemolyticus]|uniref:DUF6012 family protein n=1 Tax=Vibrio parahaemolyticus TaxID=670 RepID=A0AAW8PX93_VIBPH|nr:DUF6012 family protein [Vibrio parahaemolyticus]MDS1820758.1 DUF6012 family protein [Vibrio parahaemolyticus]